MRFSRMGIAGVLAVCVALAAALAGCSGQKAAAPAGSGGPAAGPPPTPVSVAVVKLGTIDNTFEVTGNLVALQDVELSAKAIGRVAAVNGREGDTVHAGEVLVQQDTTDLQANVNQAAANVLSAKASYAQAVSNYEIQVTNAKQGVLDAQAQVEAARQAYIKEVQGSRPQQVLESQSQLLSAKATQDNDYASLERDQTLYSEGALDKADLDTAQTNYNVAAAEYKNAQAALSLTVEGNQQEDILSALENLKQQQTNYQNAVANEKLIAVKRDAILAAQASIAQNEAAEAYAQQQLNNAYIKSPIDGVIAARTTEPGQQASPGTNLMRVVNLNTMTFQPTVSELQLSGIKPGTEVDVTADAYPDKTYHGIVQAIYPAADTTARDFTLRIALNNSDGLLKPGMYARGLVVTGVHRNVPVIPASALVAEATVQGYTPNTSTNQPITQSTLTPAQYVVTVTSDNKAHIQPVTVGYINPNRAEITSGVEAGDKIVVKGQATLNEGDNLAIVNMGHRGHRQGGNAAPAAPQSAG